jgi:DNA primase
VALFPASFIETLKTAADIVQVVQERGVALRRSGAAWKGLCPFHGEKTPSFQVSSDKGFHCFGCGVGGDVIAFVQMYDKVTFPEAVRLLAVRAGLTVPEPEGTKEEAESQRDREALLKAHEVSAAWFRDQLQTPAGAAARAYLNDRGLTAETLATLGLGFAPRSRDGLKARLLAEGFTVPVLVRGGLILERDDRSIVDRFRGRLMIPIHRDNGAIVAFGGRAMEAGQQPKYLNSPETPIYVKGRTLYGLHLSRSSISRSRYAVMVEGYFDFAQAWQAGITNVVASSGTALTPVQARVLKRFASKVVLNFDPDSAGQGAAARTSELLVAEGFQVNVAMLPPGDDPDTFIQKAGVAAYQEKLRNSQQYLEYLMDRAAAAHDVSAPEGRRDFLQAMLSVAARIPEAADRDQFADRLAHKARITEEVVRAEIRKAAVQKQARIESVVLPALGQAKPAERGLIWAVVRTPDLGLAALEGLEDEDLEGLATAGILQQARSLQGWPAASLPGTLVERLTKGEAGLVSDISRLPAAPADPSDCVKALKKLRFDRERATVQREIDRLQELGAARYEDQIVALWAKKRDLLHRIEALDGAAGVRSSIDSH